jgi:uncharacterized protein
VPGLAVVLGPLRRLAVLCSGGIDSEVLLRAAVLHLGAESVMALTSDTCFLAGAYRSRIPEVCRKLGVEYVPLVWDPLLSGAIRANLPDRCYLCRKAVCSMLSSEAFRLGYPLVADGTNLDDLGEDRPGLAAAGEEGVIHPLVAAGMGKREVREMAEELGVDDPLRPHDSCLATRVQTGLPLEAGLLALVERLEAPFRGRVRGRLRARISPGSVTLEYEAVDACLVAGMSESIGNVAAEAGYTMSAVLLPAEGS